MNQLHWYAGLTLIDITATGVTRGGDELQRNQQRNWETVLQAIGLLTQPMEITNPFAFDEPDISLLDFGEFFTGEHRVWAWEWAVEHADVYRVGNNPVAKLEECFDQIPFISGLEETARFMLPILYPYGSIRNIYFINRPLIAKII